MKVYNTKINCLAWSDRQGKIEPIKFDFRDKMYKVAKIFHCYEDKFAGNIQHVFDCIVECDNKEYECQLKYEVNTCKWILFKI